MSGPPQGDDLWQASGEVAARVAGAAADDGLEAAIRALQSGLNRFSPGDASPSPKLLEDGRYGPLTDFALKRSVAASGPAATGDAFDLGRLYDFLSQAEAAGVFDQLGDMLDRIFGGGGGADARLEARSGGILQGLLNDLGARDAAGAPLAVDGRVGAKTVAAARRAVDGMGAEEFVRGFGAARAGAVHVRSYVQNRGGRSVGVASYDRDPPARGAA